jgi:hypothetical protein
MNRFGPLYCETPEFYTGAFPVEPWNAISSMVIVLFGLAASYLVIKRQPRRYELYVLCALLITNGVGSVLWHGLRTDWSLPLDFLPALFFLLGVSFLWAWRVTPLWQALAVVGGLIAIQFGLRWLDIPLSFSQRWTIMATALVAMGIFLSYRTYTLSKEASLTGGLALASALTAATFRSLDSAACESIGFGSHFLWHIFLSAAAFLCMYTVVTLYGVTRANREGLPQRAGAE